MSANINGNNIQNINTIKISEYGRSREIEYIASRGTLQGTEGIRGFENIKEIKRIDFTVREADVAFGDAMKIGTKKYDFEGVQKVALRNGVIIRMWGDAMEESRVGNLVGMKEISLGERSGMIYEVRGNTMEIIVDGVSIKNIDGEISWSKNRLRSINSSKPLDGTNKIKGLETISNIHRIIWKENGDIKSVSGHSMTTGINSFSFKGVRNIEWTEKGISVIASHDGKKLLEGSLIAAIKKNPKFKDINIRRLKILKDGSVRLNGDDKLIYRPSQEIVKE